MFSIQELRTSTIKELQLELHNTRQELVRVRIGLKTKHLKDSSLAFKTKRYIAQILTLLKQAEKDPKAVQAAKDEKSKEVSDQSPVTSDQKKTVAKAKKVVKKAASKKKA